MISSLILPRQFSLLGHRMKKLLLILAFVFEAQAATFWVTQTGAGAADGSSLANAWSVATLNTSGNWANPKVSGKVGPGDTVKLSGTITSRWVTYASGDAGNPITILFDTGAKMSAAVWTANVGAISLNGQNYLTVDGGSNGIIECTDNGELLGNHLNNIYGVWNNGGSHIIIKNLTIQNLYVRTKGADVSTRADAVRAIYNVAANNQTDFNVWNCTIHDVAIGIVGEYAGGASNYDFGTNHIYNVNHGIDVPDRTSTSSVTGVRIHDNNIHDFANWSEVPANGYHHNAVYVWSVQGGTSVLTDVEIGPGNTFGPGADGAYQTSLVFSQGNIAALKLHDSLLILAAGESTGNNMATLSSSHVGAVFNVVGNTIIRGNTSGVALSFGIEGSGTMTANHTNNIYISGGTVGSSIFESTAASVTLNSDYNLYYGFPSTGWGQAANTTYAGMSFGTWQGLGYDAHSLTSNPNLDGNYIPQSGSPAISAGVLLSSPYNIDAAGVSRANPPTIGWKEWASAPQTVFVNPRRTRGRR